MEPILSYYSSDYFQTTQMDKTYQMLWKGIYNVLFLSFRVALFSGVFAFIYFNFSKLSYEKVTQGNKEDNQETVQHKKTEKKKKN